MRPRGLAICLMLGAASAIAQNEGRLHRDFRVEGEELEACKKLSGALDCGQTLVTGQPMHLVVGSVAPLNGFAAGLAFVEHKNFANEWRTSFDVDAVATPNGSWRAGGYMKAYRLGGGAIHMGIPVVGRVTKPATAPMFTSAPLLNFYSQMTSLKRVDYYGLGPSTLASAHTTYGFTENVTGMNVTLPVRGVLTAGRLALVAELNGRFPSVRAGSQAGIPTIGAVFNEASAPGLTHQAGYLQPMEGLRMEPALFKDRIRLNYLGEFEQFIAPGGGANSFRRWNADFNHEIPLSSVLPGKLGHAYWANRAASTGYDGPDDCTGASAGRNISLKAAARAKENSARPCPIVATTQKLEGSINLRAFVSESFAERGSVVPFYLQPTLGGSDINGTAMLASYPDYRFRGPNVLLFRESLEHSVGKLPLGVVFMADEGKVGLRRDDVSLDHLRHTLSIGLTVHAGGLPVFNLMFAWGGKEGTHTSAVVSPALLGASARPSLF